MTIFLNSPQEAQQWCNRAREDEKRIGYVPTMGALHEGHLSLVRQSITNNDITCVSIFVNPLQFNNVEDLAKYPSNLDADLEMLRAEGCDMAYGGQLSDFFDGHVDPTSAITVDEKLFPMMMGLEASHRPGHLEGVKAIVEKLFDTVGKCTAYFGEKDFQQTLLVKKIAELNGNVVVDVCPTIRENSGLAMSSRNQRLSNAGKALASIIYQALISAKSHWDDGVREAAALEKSMEAVLNIRGVRLEYAAIRNPAQWSASRPEGHLQHAQALIAVYIEDVRLIDNMYLG